MHKACSRFSGTVEIAAYIGEPAGILDVGIGGDHRNFPRIQFIYLITDERIIIWREHNAVDSLRNHFIHGTQLGLQIKTDPADEDGTVIAAKFPGFSVHALQDIIKKRISRIEKDNTDFQIFFLGGKDNACFIWFIIKGLGYFQDFPGGAGIHRSTVIQDAIHRTS